MKELLEEFGLNPNTWLVSSFIAALAVIYKIFEPVSKPTRREVVLTVVGGLISAILVPGVVHYYFKVDNPFVIGTATLLCVHSFEKYLRGAQKKASEKLNLDENGTDH